MADPPWLHEAELPLQPESATLFSREKQTPILLKTLFGGPRVFNQLCYSSAITFHIRLENQAELFYS